MPRKTKIGECEIGVTEVARALYDTAKQIKRLVSVEALIEDDKKREEYMKMKGPEQRKWAKENVYIDVRLQVHGEDWRLWDGDPQYDTDHRGAISAGSLPLCCTLEQANTLAAELINEAADMAAQ